MQCQLMESLFQAVRAFHLEESVARDYGAGVPLYHAEVSLLDVIARRPEQSASALAEALGITRGALTQTAKKLVEKGLIEPYSPPRNRKVKYHRLTPLGDVVRQGHAAYHAQANARMKAYLGSKTPEDKRMLHEFLQTLQSCMPLCLYDCEAIGCTCHLKDSPITQGAGG